jgi:crotonobetainyl-CoA:carnitine CoA-transferase CaiB-like acyl-CoA transferase
MALNPKFDCRENRLKNKEELYKILEEIFLMKTGEEWLELLERRVPISPINTIDKAEKETIVPASSCITLISNNRLCNQKITPRAIWGSTNKRRRQTWPTYL